jgi:hypothetical protein
MNLFFFHNLTVGSSASKRQASLTASIPEKSKKISRACYNSEMNWPNLRSKTSTNKKASDCTGQRPALQQL